MKQRSLNCTRAWLALLALGALTAFGVLAFFYSAALSERGITLITTVVMFLGGEIKSASSFFFDGTPPKPDQATVTTPTTEGTK